MATIADINAEARALVDADSTSYTAADLLRRVNQAYEEVVGKIIGLDGRWQFDDTNFTNLPIGTETLMAGQNDYSFDSSQLEVLRVAVKDSNGKFYFLEDADILDEHSQPLEETYSVNGTPLKYDKSGSSVFLYPAPAAGSVTLTEGLKVYFQRTASIFTSAEVTTGTKQPGFASPWHMILAYKAALPYAISYKKDRVPMLMSEIQRMEIELLNHYARREKDVEKSLGMRGISFM